jgi:hypothetical protein
LENWSANRVWLVAITLSSTIAACDSLLGRRVILIGLLIVGPCCALLAGRWAMTASTGVWVLLLALLLGIPDGIWATKTHAILIAAIAAVSVTATVTAALIERNREQHA